MELCQPASQPDLSFDSWPWHDPRSRFGCGPVLCIYMLPNFMLLSIFAGFDDYEIFGGAKDDEDALAECIADNIEGQ